MGGRISFYSVVIWLIATTSLFADNPKLVNVGLERGFAPIGFDDNDRAQVTVVGQFPDACYKVGPYKIRVDRETKSVFIQQTAYYYAGWCLKVVVPFTQVVDLGILNEGTFNLRDELSGKPLGALPVTRAKSHAPDDYLYAPVTDAHVRSEEGTSYLSLRGNFTDRCMKLKEVKISYHGDVVVVQPIAEYLGTPHNCGHEMTRFQHEEPLKVGLTGSQLLHVRSMEGQAINRIVDFP